MKPPLWFALVFSLTAAVHAEPLCVATYNLNFANRRGDQILDAIVTAAPHLICFQETTPQSERFLKEHLAETHPHFYSVGHEGRYWAERFAFACKTELKDVKFTAPTAGLFGFYSATLTFAQEEIQILNVHLTPFQWEVARRSPADEVPKDLIPPDDGNVAAAKKKTARDWRATSGLAGITTVEQTHAAEIQSITKSIDMDRHAIIMGDFNSVSTLAAPKHLLDLGLTDAFASLTANPDAHPTWRWPTRPIPLALRIDYIFHSHHFTAKKSEIVQREGSDHSLIYAVLHLGPKRSK